MFKAKNFIFLVLALLSTTIFGSELTKEHNCPQCDDKPLPCSPPLPKLLDGTKQPKFVNQLVNILHDDFVFKPDGKDEGFDLYNVQRVPFVADLGIVNKKNKRLLTPMFGYSSHHQEATYPGRTFVVKSRVPIHVFWENKLISKETGLPLPQLQYVPVDETIHLARPDNPPYPESGIPTVVHLHGGFNHAKSDGFPEAWATPNFAQVGPFHERKIFHYDNAQGPMMLWYHDHALGFTRLNNYAGLFGAYIIRGEREEELIAEHKIPTGPYEIPLVIVDKMFTNDGQLFFPYCDPEENPDEPQPSVLPEFFGDFILVNGKTWPVLEVEPREYRFRVLNACDSRFLDLHLIAKNKPTKDIDFFQIGTDQGLLNRPVKISHLLIAPAQRADLVIDFSKLKDKTLIITNTANAPFPDGDPVDPHSTGLVMAIKVTKCLNTEHPQTKLPKKLRIHPIKRLEPTAPSRQVLLFEGVDEFSRILPLLGTPSLGALHWDDPVTETPLLGSTEIWEIYNTTEDAHPIHLHSGNFQILDRQFFTGNLNPDTGVLTDIELLGKPIPISPAEEGLFDTVIVPPKSEKQKKAIGQRTRIIMNFTLPGRYVWHCHILSHEDHDMMRPMTIIHE